MSPLENTTSTLMMTGEVGGRKNFVYITWEKETRMRQRYMNMTLILHIIFVLSQLTSYWNIIHFMAHLDNNMSTRRAVLVSIFSQAYSISDLPWISGHCAGSNWVWQVLSNLLENTKLLFHHFNLHYIWTTLGQSHFWIFRSDKYIDWRAYDLELYKSTLLQFLNHLGIVGDRNTNVTLVGHNWGFLLGGTLIKGNKLIYIVSRIFVLRTRG